jgi:hypothetical protein
MNPKKDFTHGFAITGILIPAPKGYEAVIGQQPGEFKKY